MKVQKIELANKLSKLKAVMPKKTPMAALQTVLVKDGYLIASDLEITAMVKCEGMSDASESFLIPDTMIPLISSLPAGEVEFIPEKVKDGMQITMKTGKIVNKFQSLDPEVYPASKTMSGEVKSVEIDAEDLTQGITHVLFAVGTDEASRMMQALSMSCADGYLNFRGLDGHMCAWDSVPMEGTFNLLVPRRSAQQILNMDMQGTVVLETDGSTARFVTEYVTVETRLIAGDYFKTDKLYAEMPQTAQINRKEFIEAISRASSIKQDTNVIKLTFGIEAVKIEMENNRNIYAEEVNLKVGVNNSVRIGFDPRLLLAALKSFESDYIFLNIDDAAHPIKLQSDESALKAVVLPIAIKQ